MKNLVILILGGILCLFWESCNEGPSIEPSACGGSATQPKIDLVLLIDASGSMVSAARSIDAAATVFTMPIDSCPADLRINYFGVEGTFSGTVFTTNHRTYLNGLVPAGTPFSGDLGHVGLRQEQGANAISDLSNFMDWREGACRAILYISDEELDSIEPSGDFANENSVTLQAIADAQANTVTVFTHYLTYQNRSPQILENYNELTSMTGRSNITTSDQSVS